eukprot:CAMPEP_0180754008 /NCGR_PEP_ID=MMETSP1038_2-20121128/32972_1 /TAXON_ID=632150 /ORGANISM="Azadinium spinosum, Strain 3D9" /LENGTH=148 /DNA_ID=CAMNT_0022787903 /DNA_START=268 /DNA_END=711 /DNA_ORIENTATION=+
MLVSSVASDAPLLQHFFAMAEMAQARPAQPTESTAPIFACPWSSASVNASFATKSATVSPTPPSADIAKRSPIVTPSGKPKPIAQASNAKPAMPRVLPTASATMTEYVTPPTDPSLTPALANPKKNIPKSTTNFRSASNLCSGADSIW